MRGRVLTAAAALATGLLAAPAAAAVEIDEIKSCYVSAGEAPEQREGIEIRARDFTPASLIDISIDGVVTQSGFADTVGDVSAREVAPFQQDRARAFTLTVTERTNPANTITVGSRVTPLDFMLKPAKALTRRRVRYKGSGFTLDKPIFAHYIHRGEERKRVRLAKRPRGDCGRFSSKRRQIPVRRPATGTWIVQVDQQRRYSEAPDSNVVRRPIEVRRELKRKRP